MNVPARIHFVDHSTSYEPSPTPRVENSVRMAFLSIMIFLIIFGIWSWAAPLNSAAIAPGVLEAAGGGRRTVQHLEGGIVREFVVVEGQKVRAGQPLVLLDTTQNDARDGAIRSALYGLLAQDARLTAERLGLASIKYPNELMEAPDQREVAAIIATTNTLFISRNRSLIEQRTVLTQRLGQAQADIRSSTAQLSAVGDQAKLLDDEEFSVKILVDEGLERKSRLLALQRQKSVAEGQQGQLTNNLDRIRKTIDETQAQMTFLRGQMVTDAATQQRDVQMQIAETREKLAVSDDIRNRQQILAPVDGAVSNLRLITPGGVIGPGQPILDIVPSHEKIVVAARLKANDIDIVHPGLRAEVKLMPFKARVLPGLKGIVREVSPDALFDEDSRELYYKIKVEIEPSELKKYKGVKLTSGMPTEVFIDVGSNSLMQYLVQPMLDSFQRAFREY